MDGVVASERAFGALNDGSAACRGGSIKRWGDALHGGSGFPTSSVGSGAELFANEKAFALLYTSGSNPGYVEAWGDSTAGAKGHPTGYGFTSIHASREHFVTIKDSNGLIRVWPTISTTTTMQAPTTYLNNPTHYVVSTEQSACTLHDDKNGNSGTDHCWGLKTEIDNAPTDSGTLRCSRQTKLTRRSNRTDSSQRGRRERR